MQTVCATGSVIDLSHYHQYSLLVSFPVDGFAQSPSQGSALRFVIAVMEDLKQPVFPVPLA